MSNPDNGNQEDTPFPKKDLPDDINESVSETPHEHTSVSSETSADQLPSQPDAADPDVYNDQSKSIDMEVHHHGHVHEKKKWKEYLFQFLMLFLAVFCGFLAENQREHMIEYQREKKYVRSLLQDLKTDTAKLRAYITKRAEKRILMDSLTTCLLPTNISK